MTLKLILNALLEKYIVYMQIIYIIIGFEKDWEKKK